MTAPSGRFERGPKRLEAVRELPSIEGLPPPHDLDAEAAVISAIILQPARFVEVSFLRPDHFYSGSYGAVYTAMLEVMGSGQSLDITTLANRLRDTGRLGQVEHGKETGLPALAGLIDASPALANLSSHAQIVIDKARLRKMAHELRYAHVRCYHDSADPSELLTEIEQKVTEVARENAGNVPRITVDEIFAPIPETLPWLVPSLRLIQGRANFFVGFPFSGKTLVAQSLGLSVAADVDVWGTFNVQSPGKVVHLNYDQPKLDTRVRYQRLARGLGITADDLRGKLELVQYPRIYLDKPEHDGELRALCRGAKLLIIDALTGSVIDVDENKPEMGRVVYRINAISEETGTTIIVIHHASPKGRNEVRGNKDKALETPQDLMRMVRGSSSIFGAAGSVFILEPMGLGKPIRMHHAKTPALDSSLLDTFGLSIADVEGVIGMTEDLEEKRDRRWGVRIDHMHPDELAAYMKAEKKKKKGDDDSGQRFQQVLERVLEFIKAKPGLSGLEIKAQLGKIGKDTLYAAIKELVREKKIASEKGPKNAELWRAV